jgi:hypothetical protein
VGKEYHEKSMEGNTFVCDSSSDVRRLKLLFQNDDKAREGGKQIKYDFFQVTAMEVPQPTQLHPILLHGTSKMLPNRFRREHDNMWTSHPLSSFLMEACRQQQTKCKHVLTIMVLTKPFKVSPGY